MPLIGKTIDEKIWNYLKAQGLTDFGAAGLIGNLQAESGLSSTNLQNSFENAPAKTGGMGYTDASYTAAVDSGAYTGFVIVKAATLISMAATTFFENLTGSGLRSRRPEGKIISGHSSS